MLLSGANLHDTQKVTNEFLDVFCHIITAYILIYRYKLSVGAVLSESFELKFVSNMLEVFKL